MKHRVPTCCVLLALAACRNESSTTPAVSPGDQKPGATTQPTSRPVASRPTEKASDFPNLKIEVVQPGTGAVLEYGMRMKMHYVGTLLNGRQFDSSRDSGEPLDGNLESDRLIKGWILGLEGMRVGEKRRVIIPPELAYGAQGNGAVPPNSTLVFDVELMDLPKDDGKPPPKVDPVVEKR